MNNNPVAGKIDWPAVLAETIAKQDFYRALGEQIRLAGRGEASFPVVPPTEELTFVDGFLVWNGRPVWWSGDGGPAAATDGMNGPGFLNAETFAQPMVRTEAGRRPGRQRWFSLPWRWV